MAYIKQLKPFLSSEGGRSGYMTCAVSLAAALNNLSLTEIDNRSMQTTVYSEHLHSALTAVLFIFIAVVSAVIVPITCPHPRDTLAITAEEFVVFTGQILGHAHSVLIYQFHTIITFTLSLREHNTKRTCT